MSVLAKLVGTSAQAVTNWAARGVPVDRAPAIELATGGAVTVEELRPDVSWVRVLDAQWPRGRGRPCIDVAERLAA